jgi:hypothetical protein
MPSSMRGVLGAVARRLLLVQVGRLRCQDIFLEILAW